VVLLLVALFAGESVQRGTLYLNEIQALLDPITNVQQLPIECTLWEDNMVFLDSFNSRLGPGNLNGSGVFIDGALLNAGTWVFPNNFDVAGVVTIGGLLSVNGGLFTDDSSSNDDDDNNVSFALEDDTGNVFIAGTLTVNRGINNQRNLTNPNGNFRVNPEDGLTTINGLLQPNAGVNINNGAATISAAGAVVSQDSLFVNGNVILGTDLAESRSFVPFTNGPGVVPSAGGRTTFLGQDAADVGGDYVLSPGFGVGTSLNQRSGDILLGLDNRAHDLSINRVGPTIGNAGDFIFGGQNAAGKGGDILVEAGFAGPSARGGNIIFAPGESNTANGVVGLRGLFYLGDPADGANIPFYVQRPDITNSDRAAATFIGGQNVTNGNAGATVIAAGDGSTSGGSVFLQPGTSGNTQGRVVFRNERNGPTDLRLVRADDTTSDIDGGDTWLIGQDSQGGDGGNIILEAGAGSSVSSGNLVLSPGSNDADIPAGTIFWGPINGQDTLNIVRPSTVDNPAHDTTFLGASSSNNNGGELLLLGGNGVAGGDVVVSAGAGEEDHGGDVFITGGEGAGASTGGSIQILQGSSDDTGVSGSISFTAGDAGRGGSAGSIFLSAVGNSVTFNAAELFLDSVPFFYDNNEEFTGEFTLDNGVTLVSIRADINDNDLGLITYDPGVTGGVVDDLIRDRIRLSGPFRPTINPYESTLAAAQDVYDALQELRAGLTAHELIQVNTLLIDTELDQGQIE